MDHSASTVVGALIARSAVGHHSVSTVVGALECKECGGRDICEHGRRRSHLQGVRWGVNMRARSSAP